jgi:hypothetical protein
MIITLLIILCVSIGVVRLVTHLVYGSLLSSKDFLKSLENKINKGNNRLSYLSSNIIYVDNLPISHIPFDILSKYYIEDVGTIPRWSKVSLLLDNEFKRLKKKHLDNLVK